LLLQFESCDKVAALQKGLLNVTATLDAAHEAKIVHRNIKPQHCISRREYESESKGQ
jgi:hypothetical protein